jgi:hypothetical protein
VAQTKLTRSRRKLREVASRERGFHSEEAMNHSISTRRILQSTLLAGAAVLLAAGCGSAPDGSARAANTRESLRASDPVATSRAALEIERAARDLDVGKNAAGAAATLQSVLDDPATSRDDHDRAEIQLARALEAQGKHEDAVETVEKLLRAHVDDHQWALERAATRELRKLLTGSATTHEPSTINANISPFARVLASYYPVPSDSKTAIQVKVLAFGGDDGVSGRLGTFNIPEALSAEQDARCPLCDHVYTHMHEDDSDWTQIPAYESRLGSAIDVFYFDLGADRIPKRYEKYLPLPIDQIVQHLNQGEGLIAAENRQAAPPVILLAAPRRAQLPDVEKKLASLDRLPTAPLTVDVPAKLRPGEIQAIVRSARDGYKRCYQALLKTNPAAAGKLTLSFAIEGDGTVSDAKTEADGAELDDATLQACVTRVTAALSFPATNAGQTTVRYPVVFSPKNEK